MRLTDKLTSLVGDIFRTFDPTKLVVKSVHPSGGAESGIIGYTLLDDHKREAHGTCYFGMADEDGHSFTFNYSTLDVSVPFRPDVVIRKQVEARLQIGRAS